MLVARLTVRAYDEKGVLTGQYYNGFDPILQQWMQIMAANVLGVAQTNVVKDTGGALRTVGVNTTCSAWCILAGIGTTTPLVNDFKLQTATAGGSGSVTATLGSIIEVSGATGTYTVTGSINNTSGVSVTYSEVGIQTTAATFQFLLTHDTFSGLPVSNGGTLVVAYQVVNQ